MTIVLIAIMWAVFLVGVCCGAWFAHHVHEERVCPLCLKKLEQDLDEWA